MVAVAAANHSRFPNFRLFWDAVGGNSDSRPYVSIWNLLLQKTHMSASSVVSVLSLRLPFDDRDQQRFNQL